MYGSIVHYVPNCMSCHKAIVVITRKTHRYHDYHDYIYIYIHTYTYIHIYIYIHTHTHTHTHIEDFEVKWNSILYNAERNIVELLLYEAEKVITKIQVEIEEEVNEKNKEKCERKYVELERHSRFERKLDQRHRKKWKKVKERNIKNHEKKIILESTGTNSSLLIIQSKLVNKTSIETINDSLFRAVVKDSIQLKKGNVSFSQLKRTATEKLRNSEDGFSNFVNAKLKVDETFITDNRIARKNKKSYAEAVRYDNTSTCANTTDLSKIYCELLACKKVIPLTRECALLIYAQTQQKFLIVRICRLVKMMPMSFLHKMRNYFLFCRIYNRICHLRQTVVASVLMGISAQARVLI